MAIFSSSAISALILKELLYEMRLFYCYAHEDKPLRDELELHLSSLKRRYSLSNWNDREILPGMD